MRALTGRVLEHRDLVVVDRETKHLRAELGVVECLHDLERQLTILVGDAINVAEVEENGWPGLLEARS